MPVPDAGNRVAGKVTDSPICWTDTPWGNWTSSSITVKAKVTIVVTLDAESLDRACPQPSGGAIYERILKEEVATDMAIVAGNGVEIKCHRSFLMVHSQVLEGVLKIKTEEPGVTKIEMTGMTEASVRAFLAYLYYSDVTAAQTDCEVAFELLESAKKYDISGLKESTKSVLLEKDNAWFTVATALRLFLFARIDAGEEPLKAKAVQILKM